ncbi:hypothetical protein HEQ61_02100 [Haematospirillum sp. H4485]|nr:hypothetical protein [Haematospirillum sp. H4890]NKD74443.1 hypothetical protein [Haematospirillum sp. H4485]
MCRGCRHLFVLPRGSTGIIRR